MLCPSVVVSAQQALHTLAWRTFDRADSGYYALQSGGTTTSGALGLSARDRKRKRMGPARLLVQSKRSKIYSGEVGRGWSKCRNLGERRVSTRALLALHALTSQYRDVATDETHKMLTESLEIVFAKPAFQDKNVGDVNV